jgi:Na+:H+ antiporter, NhaA family
MSSPQAQTAKQRWRWWQKFAETERLGGLMAIIAALVALVWAASNYDHYHLWRTMPLHFAAGAFDISFPMRDIINNGLMVLFFFAVGLELKEATTIGALSQKGQAFVPLMAALGGMMMPIVLYMLVVLAHPSLYAGAVIPCATDLALSLAVLRLAGRKMPQGALPFLSAFGIYDDILAIILLAIFYGGGFALAGVPWVLALLALLWLLHYLRAAHVITWLVVCACSAVALHKIGVHASVAGVIAAQAVNMTPDASGHRIVTRLLHALHKPVVLLIVPLFVLCNAGVPASVWQLSTLQQPLVWGIVVGLVVGKMVGISGAVFLTLKFLPQLRPQGFTPAVIFNLSLLGGIGFTVALMIAQLAFADEATRLIAVGGIVVASIIASVFSIVGMSLLPAAAKK